MHPVKIPRKVVPYLAFLLLAGSEAIAQTAAAPGAARTQNETASNDSITRKDSEVYVLTPFEVKTETDYGYRKQSSVTTSRIGADITTLPQAVEIISSELLKDYGLDDFVQSLRYTSSVIVGEREINQTGQSIMRGFGTQSYYNGLGLARTFTIAPFLPSDNLDRIEIAKGPVGVFYGNSTPNGVVNYITKKPQFINRTNVTVTAGSYGLQKAVVDTQAVIDKKLGIAYRLIASSQRNQARVDDYDKDYVLLSPSIEIRPSPKLTVSLEASLLQGHNPYPGNANVWSFNVNPQYYADLDNPSQQVLNYMKSTFGAADDAAARALVKQRWAPVDSAGLTTRLTSTWANDTLAATGTQPFATAGDKVEWWRYSPRGDKFATQSIESNFDGRAISKDAAVTFTPIAGLSLRYHWVNQEVKQNFIRSLYQGAFGNLYRPDGRASGVNASTINTLVQDKNYGLSDTQQIDVYAERRVFGVKNMLNAGVELKRTVTYSGVDPLDFTKAPPVVNRNGVTLTGIQTFQQWDPFLTPRSPNIFTIQAGANTSVVKAIGKQEEQYVSYRASAINDRLNVLAGLRHIKDKVTLRKGDTHTFGAIYEVIPSLFVFGSVSKSLLLVNQYDIVTVANVPLPESVLLQNEDGKGFEVGFKTNWKSSAVSGTLSYFDNERAGIVTANFLGTTNHPRNTDTDPNNDVRVFQNAGLQRVRGVDLDLIWTPTKNLQFVLNSQYLQEARVVSDPSINPNIQTATWVRAFRLPLARSPKFRANLLGKYTFDSGRLKGLSLGAGLRYHDLYYITNAALAIYVPEEYLIDAFASYRIKARIPTTLQLNVTNITNEINDMTRDDGLSFRGSVSVTF